MACYHPISGFRGLAGKVTFQRSQGFRDRAPITIACGQCKGCRLERSRQWAIRCVHENQMHEQNSFLTLTYAPEHYPHDHSLNIEHWQQFTNRLRSKRGKFRYFHCGEYGDEYFRPHYHAIIFGFDFSEDRIPYKKSNGHQLYTSEELNDLWKLGTVFIGDSTFQSAAYIARYIMKKQTGKDSREYYEQTDRYTGEVFTLKPPYISMSLKPGIGAPWLAKWKTDVYPQDVCIIDGKKLRPPKYYDVLLERDDPQALEILKRRREALGKTHEQNNTPARLATREVVHHERSKKNAIRELPLEHQIYIEQQHPNIPNEKSKPLDHDYDWLFKFPKRNQ